jgi:hypothetical protein
VTGLKHRKRMWGDSDTVAAINNSKWPPPSSTSTLLRNLQNLILRTVAAPPSAGDLAQLFPLPERPRGASRVASLRHQLHRRLAFIAAVKCCPVLLVRRYEEDSHNITKPRTHRNELRSTI